MAFSCERKTVSRREDGTEIVRVTISRPSEYPYLKTLTERAEAWADQILVPRARQAFLNDPDPSKRFRFRRFEYDLNISLTPVDDETAELCIEATLGRAHGERLAEERSVHVVRLDDGVFLPPTEVSRAKKQHP